MLSVIVKRTARRLGLDLRRYRPANSPGPQMISMLSSHRVNLVFDVGANTGQFATALRDDGFVGRIVSFEALASAHERLLFASKNDPLWEVAPQAAMGAEDGEINLHVANNSVSSSVLEMLPAHVDLAPGARYVGIERVPSRRLDSLAQAYFRNDSVSFLKVDTQGYEDRVLDGAACTLKQVVGIHLEVSLIHLYDGQRLFLEIAQRLKHEGFDLWAIWQSFVDENSGRLLQADATFFRC